MTLALHRIMGKYFLILCIDFLLMEIILSNISILSAIKEVDPLYSKECKKYQLYKELLKKLVEGIVRG